MKHALPNLESLKVFEAAARHLSFSSAARELCMTKGAVSYQIKKLESQLNIRLFKRSVRQVLLTDPGQMLYQEVQKIFTSLGSSLANLSANLDTTITIAVTTYVAARWLSPRISDFCEQHPDTTVRFVHNVNTELFDITDVDIAIRWGKCGEPEPHRVHEIPMPLFACAKPALIRNHCASREMTDLGNLTLLCEDRTEDLWREWTDPQTSIEGCARRTIEDANVRVQAAVDGMGLILADDMMQFELQAGLLERFGDRNLPGYGYTLLRNPLTAKRPLVNELVFDIIR